MNARLARAGEAYAKAHGRTIEDLLLEILTKFCDEREAARQAAQGKEVA